MIELQNLILQEKLATTPFGLHSPNIQNCFVINYSHINNSISKYSALNIVKKERK